MGDVTVEQMRMGALVNQLLASRLRAVVIRGRTVFAEMHPDQELYFAASACSEMGGVVFDVLAGVNPDVTEAEIREMIAQCLDMALTARRGK